MYNRWAPQNSYIGASPSQTDIFINFPSLANMTFSELAKLEGDEEEVRKMVEECEIVKKKQQEKDELMARIRSLADYNLSQEPVLNRLKIQLSQTHEQAVESFKEYEKNKIQLDACPSKTSKDVQLALLQTEAAKTEEECENLTSMFLSKGVEVDEFVEQYIEKRKLSNIRRIKAEKMSELIRNAPSHTTPSNNHPSHPAPYPFPYTPYQPFNHQSKPPSNPYNQPSLPFHPSQPPYPSAVFTGNQAFPQPSLY